MTTAPHQQLTAVAAPADDELLLLDAYWRTANHLPVGMQIDRYNLVIDVIDRVDSLGSRAAHIKERMKDEIEKQRNYAYTVGMDAPEINNWRWKFGRGNSKG